MCYAIHSTLEEVNTMLLLLLLLLLLSRFSHVRLCATPQTAAHQAPLSLAPPSMGFSRQEYWSGVPLPSPKHYAINAFSLYFWSGSPKTISLTPPSSSEQKSRGCFIRFSVIELQDFNLFPSEGSMNLKYIRPNIFKDKHPRLVDTLYFTAYAKMEIYICNFQPDGCSRAQC